VVFDDFLDDVDRGREGRNYGLSTGIKKLDKAIGGVQGNTYYLIGGNTGTGKSAFVDHAFVLSPYANYLQSNINSRYNETPIIKPRIFYYSMEISARKKIAKWVCHLMYERHKMIIDIKEVYSKQSILADEKYRLIKSCRDYIEGMMDYVHIFDSPINPFGIYKTVSSYMEKNGKITEQKRLIKGEELSFKKYIPNDPYEIVLVIVDHIGLLRPEKEFRTKKEIIDHDSENAISLRNFFGVSRVSISQFNRELADIDRRRFTELSPQLEDFKNTGNASEDAEVVMTIFNPARYNLVTYGGSGEGTGFNLTLLGGRYRSASILKQRDGEDMLKLNLNFMGEAGHFRDYPDPFMQHHYKEAREYTKFT
jgi:replicative DNA helicase